jgi:hypothetical protein
MLFIAVAWRCRVVGSPATVIFIAPPGAWIEINKGKKMKKTNAIKAKPAAQKPAVKKPVSKGKKKI